MTENDNKQPHTVGRQLASGVFYTSIAKYAGIVVTLVVSGVLARLFTPEEFGVVNIATVVIAFFAIFSDLGIGPAVIQHKNLDKRDLGGIFSLTLWSGAVMALLFFAASGLIASFYDDSAELRNILRILSANLFFAAANIVPNGLILKEKRFRFAAVRSLSVQVVGGAAAIAAAYAGAGIYALTINPVFSSLMLFVINYRQNPLSVHLKPGKATVGKVFSFSAYQFSFQLLNYFSRNLDKLLMGRYMSLSQLGYYDKSYRLMMLPLQNIAYVVSPVMHPIFSEMQNDLRKLADSYRKVVRLLALIGLPLSVVLWFTAQELVLIIFGDQWQPSVPVFRILALSVGIQIVMSTSGSIFQRHADALLLRPLLGGAQHGGHLHRHLRLRHDPSRGVVHLHLVRNQLHPVLPRAVLPDAAHGVGRLLAQFPLAPAALGARLPSAGGRRMAAAADAYARVACGERRRGAGRVAALHPVQRRIRPERNRPPSPLPQKLITQ